MNREVSHALLFEGGSTDAEIAAQLAAEALGMIKEGNPDIQVFAYDMLPIEEVRRLTSTIYSVPLVGDTTLTVIATDSIGREAQNALLKLTEDPPQHAVIALVVPSIDMLLPTLRSRFGASKKIETVREVGEAEAFLRAAFPARQKIIANMIAKKEPARILALVEDIERHIAGEWKKKKSTDMSELLHELADFRLKLRQKGMPTKFMLEHLAITLPVLK